MGSNIGRAHLTANTLKGGCAKTSLSSSFELVERADSFDPETKTTTFKFVVDGVTRRVLGSATLLSKKGATSTCFLVDDVTTPQSKQKLVVKIIKFIDAQMAEKVRPTIKLLRQFGRESKYVVELLDDYFFASTDPNEDSLLYIIMVS
jgi:hypothetical protein